jgi:Rieske Fe-S protein
VYDVSGQVLEGPPPKPLSTIDARVEGAEESVLVRV